MRLPRFAVLVLLAAIVGCGKVASPQGYEGKVAQQQAHNKKIPLKVDLTIERQLQAEVDKGHQPWRLNAGDVAASLLSQFTEREVTTDECVIESMNEKEAIVKYSGEHIYRVYLKRLVSPSGIWTAVEIEVE